ncbi:MAG: winged helix-turn-helix transcriptional regulator [Thermoplasmatota archaeon]
MEENPLTENIKKELDLLQRTLNILAVIEEEGPIGISRLSERLDIPEHRVRYSLRMLEKEKLIEPSPRGAKLTDKHGKFKEEFIEHLQDIRKTVDSLGREIRE